MIYLQATYVNENGHPIIERLPIDASVPGKMRVVGAPLYHTDLVFQIPCGGQMLNVQAREDIDASSIGEAFEKLPAAIEAGQQKAMKAVQETMNRAAGASPGGIVLPGAVPPHQNGELRRPRLAN